LAVLAVKTPELAVTFVLTTVALDLDSSWLKLFSVFFIPGISPLLFLPLTLLLGTAKNG
jgi:hypothetical protein